MGYKKGCFHSGCPEVITGDGAYCDKHKKKKWKSSTKRTREVSEREQKFYSSKLWINTSRGFRAKHPNCRQCARENTDTFGDEVDHIIPLKVAWHLRLDPRNLQTLCRSCHAKKRAREAKMYEEREDGIETRCTIVCGPPASGKTTYVQERMSQGDLVLDVDYLFAAISFQSLHRRENYRDLLPYALAARDAILERAVLDGNRRPNFWFIVGAPNPVERKQYQETFKASVVVLATPKEICFQRLESNKARSHQLDKMREVICEWWHVYEPRHGQEIIYEG